MSALTVAEKRALVAGALVAAREAAALVSEGWRTRPKVEHKGRVDLVTEYDRRSELLLRERLAQIASFPVVGEEEGGASAMGGAPTWYVDPLDGTTNFVHGHPFFCVSVGLLAGNTPLLGVVVAPAIRVEWTGIVADGAFRNGEPCRVSEVPYIGDALLATGFPYDRSVSADNNFDAFIAIKRRSQAVRRCGSAAMDLCLVADGTYDGYWERKLKPWDLAAGAAIVVAAGGKISDFAGGEADIVSGHLLATNGTLHEGLVAELASFPPAPRAR